MMIRLNEMCSDNFEDVKKAAQIIAAFCKNAEYSGCGICPLHWSPEKTNEPGRCICDVCEPRSWNMVREFWMNDTDTGESYDDE
jgi:hypothetical protein